MAFQIQKQFDDLDDATFFFEKELLGVRKDEILEAKLVFVNNRWVVGVILKEIE